MRKLLINCSFHYESEPYDGYPESDFFEDDSCFGIVTNYALVVNYNNLSTDENLEPYIISALERLNFKNVTGLRFTAQAI